MSDTSSDDTKKSIEEPNENLSKVMGHLSVKTDDSDKTSKSPKNLSDMPVDVVPLIIERSDLKEQLILRKTSKFLRELVDKQEPALTCLKVSCKRDCIICWYNNHCVAYIQPSWHHAYFLEYSDYRLDTIVSKVNYEQVAFDDLASIFKNPKLQLENFSFNIADLGGITYGMDFQHYMKWKFDSGYKKMQKTLESINHQLSVKTCRIDVTRRRNVMSILPYLKPGVLEKITIFMEADFDEWGGFSENIKQVSLLEQWKQAEELQLEDGIDDTFPTEYFTHFKRFQFDEDNLVAPRFIWIRDYILEHENAEFCLITVHSLSFERLDGTMGTLVSPNLYRYTVPFSKYYLEFKIEKKQITIEKKQK